MNTSSTTVGDGGIKVLLLPGLFGANEAFDAMLAFADTVHFQYVVMDYRGYGHAKNLPGRYTLNEVVADAIRLLDHLGWDQVHLAGHSIGALVAQMIAVAAPERIQSIVSLAGMNARGASRDPARMRMLDEAAHHVSQRAAVIHMGVSKRYGMAFAQHVAQNAWEAIAPQACAGYAADAALTDIHTQVDGSEIPLLALVGTHDPGCTEQLARDTTLRWYRNAVLEVISEAGHYPMIEAPARTLAAVESFLRGQRARHQSPNSS